MNNFYAYLVGLFKINRCESAIVDAFVRTFAIHESDTMIVFSDESVYSRTLHEIARRKYEQSNSLSFHTHLYNAGWHNGEWTCACCGTMIGKNLNGDSPFGLAREHVHVTCHKLYQ